MKTFEISFNSRADLERQIGAFREKQPRAQLEETQINGARARAIEMDNDGNAVGERLIFKIGYTEAP
jgi:hypothetical protein